MRQVPPTTSSPRASVRYAVFGSGRMARHFRHYLDLLGLEHFSAPHRGSLPDLRGATHAVLLVADRGIAALAARLPGDLRRIHFSGALVLDEIDSAHPLMTFGPELYDLETYARMSFAIAPGKKLEELLPGLPNPSFAIEAMDRALYHALAVAAGNFSAMLWREVFARAERLGVPRAAWSPFLERTLANTLADPSSITGPISRGDTPTIRAHEQALARDPKLLALYQAFLRLAQVPASSPGGGSYVDSPRV